MNSQNHDTVVARGVHAALLTPRDADGSCNEAELRRILAFLRERKIDRVVVNGATGECCLTRPADLRRILAICRDALGDQGSILCGIGAPALYGSLELGRVAIEGGARALLLPMPYFFRYTQDDLAAFCATAAANLDAPILLYNLPVFTNPLQLDTVLRLLDSSPNVIGIKDSSGSLDILRGLGGTRACRIIGDDSVLVSALAEGACDCVISGVAGVLPELIRFLFGERGSPEYRRVAGMLEELIAHLSKFPTPWGLKLIAECRGLAEARFFQPLSAGRISDIGAFREWFGSWWPEQERTFDAS